MKYCIVTNNPYAAALAKGAESARDVKDAGRPDDCDAQLIEGAVSEVLARCGDLLLEGGWRLAVDFMGGRRARAFPYLTVVLQRSGAGGDESGDWERIVDYQLLDAGRRQLYEAYGEDLREDFRILDFSLTKAAFERLK